MFGCWRAAALWTAAVLILAPELSAAQARPVTIDDLMTMPSFGEGSLSPDGQWGVYERRDGWAMSSRFDLSYWSGWTTSELWVFGMSDRRPPKRLLDASEGRGHVLGPWSPSGRRLLIYRLQGDRFEAGVVDVEDLSVRWTGLTPNLSATGATATWADDETLVLAVLDDLGLPWLMRQYSPPTSVSARWRRMAEGRTRTSTVVDTHDGVAGSDQAAQAARLVSWSVQSGEFRRLGEGRVLDFSMAPDGARIAVLTAGAPVPLSPEAPLVQSAFPVRSRLSVVTLSSGKVVTPIQPLDIAPHLLSWRKDGGAVLVWSRRDDQIWSAGGLTAVSAHNGQVTRYLHDGLQPLVVGEAIDLLHGVRATWLGADPILYARTRDGRFDWWRLGGDRPKKLTASLTTAPATFSGADTDGLTFVADGAVWRLALSGTTVRLGPDQAVSAAGMATEKQVLRQRLNAPEPRDWSPVQTGRGDLAIVTSYGDEKTLGDPIAAAPDRLYAVSRSAAIISRSDRGATALWLLRAGRERQLDVVNLNMTSRSTATIVTVSHLDRYGRRTHSLLYLPPETPTSQIKGVVVSGYPGAASAGRAFQLDDFVVGVNPLVIASAGYAWLQAAAPDNPSAVGPADGYRESLDLAIAAARGLQPDLPWDRLALFGHSFGGYGALKVATETPRYRSIIASSAGTNFFSKWGEFSPIERADPQQGLSLFDRMGWVEVGQGGIGAPPWRAPQAYRDASPVLSADRIQTPVLLITGDRDFVSMSEPEQMFSALHRQAKAARLITYWGEGHFIWSPANQRDLYAQILGWLAETLDPSSVAGPPGGPPRSTSRLP